MSYPRDRTLAQLFEAQVDRAPHATALVDGDRRLSYGELEHRANQVAARLRARGIAAGELVGLCVERSAEMVIALLGICKAGAAYVPLDPSYPKARLAAMLEDAAPRVLLTHGDVAASLPGFAGEVLALEDEAEGGAARRPAAAGGAGDAAYVIYTSGTTGRPKGVVTPQRAVSRLVLQTNYVRIRSSDVLLALSPLSFDAATFEIWGALLNGARLVVHRARRFDPREVIEVLQREGVSILWLTAALFDELTLHHLGGLTGLRYLLAGGDVLPVAAIRRALDGLPDTTLINGYGPTETTTFATAFRFPRDWAGASAPIGRAISHTEVHILDEARRPVEAGAIGELYIGGDGLADGYLHLPELTAQKFVANPLDGGATRLYRTGDRGRWLPDGTIEFLGRDDQQVKLRGFRIELEEIENALTADPQIDQAVVVLREPTPGDKRLVAYAVAAGRGELELSGVRQRLAERLPEYMVPALILAVERLPVTPNGKVDRAALPAVTAEAWELAAVDYVAPRGATEERLAALWCELLNLPRIGRDDDFFALGGHSLLVGRLAARLRAAMGVETSLAALYRAPTLEQMAAHLDRRGADPTAPPPPPPLTLEPASGPAPLSFPQERVWFLERMVPGNLAYQMQATLELVGPLDAAALAAALGELVARHGILRTAFKEIDGAPVQEVQPAYPVELPVVELAGGSIDDFLERAYQRIKVETARPYALEQGRLARWMLFRHTAERHLLLHGEHHLVHDGWSLAIFLDELKTLYAAFRSGAASPLPPPPLQFADFARWQRRWLTGPVLEAFLEHWRRALTPVPPPLDLPTDRPRPPVFNFKGHSLREDFDRAEYARLRAAAKAHNVTLFTVMFSGFSLLLARYAQQAELVVGVGAANRRLAEAERLLGMMINTLPLRVDLRGEPTFAELLAQVHRTAIEAYAWQDVPLDRLVDTLALPRDPSRNPLFSVIFSFHDAAVPDLSFADLEARLRIEQNGSAKTDINIIVIPRAEQRVGRAASFEDDSLSIIWEYATDLFDEATMRQMLDDYHGLLAAGIEHPELPVSRLPLGSAPRPRLAAPHAPALSAAQQLAARIAEAPDRVAVRRGAREIRYGALLAEAGAANAAGEGGPARGERGERGERDGLAAVLRAVAKLTSEVASAELRDLMREAPARIGEALSGAGFAGPGETVLQLAAPDDERFCLEVWGALLGGATLLLLDEEERAALAADRDGSATAAAISRAATAARPAALVLTAALADALSGRHAESLRGVTAALVLGGAAQLTRLAQCGPRRVWLGAGAPRWPLALLGEATGASAGGATSPTSPTLRPIDGVTASLRDGTGAELPPGAISALDFVVGDVRLPSPWRARRRRDGSVELRGAADEAGEVAGFAVDLHDARAALLACEELAEAHLELRDGQLVAHVATVAATATAHSPMSAIAAVRTRLSTQLPGYQAPSRYVTLAALPLDRHGLVDRAALPAADAASDDAALTDCARTQTQERVAAICAELLGLPAVDLHANFFLLGGRSLLATRLVALVNRQLGVDLPVATFLRQPTLFALAAAVDSAAASTSAAPSRSARRHAAELLANLDRLSDAEVNDLLKEIG